MAQRTVFYSWQSDLPNGTNRSFIESCLNKAIKDLKGAQPRLDPCLDRDTANVPGSPDIAATILDKIDNCHIFVCDTSIVQSGQRPMPNPNVLFELGYAVKRLGWDRVICIANEHFGAVERLPFDVRQRRVKCYTLSPETQDRTETSKALTRELCRELEFVLTASQEEGERLQLQFADIEMRTPLGRVLQHGAVFYTCDLQAIPDFHYEDKGGPFGEMIVRVGSANRDYHRQLAQYIQQSMMVRKIGFVVFNGNRKAISDLTMQIVFKKAHGLLILDEKPSAPAQSQTDMLMRGINPISSYFARPGRLTVNELPDRYELRVEFGKVQPEANAWSEPVFVGTSESCNLEVSAALYGDELTTPKQVTLNLSFQVTETPIDKLSDEEWARLVGAS
jgi:hypothetical protein